MDNDDYNDNDYEGHNLQLAGEESSKFSSELRPFTLPKFDYDDSIHGHLRFDSLVENEVFLGIPSQDDDQWIEDFSRGSSVIGFSSSATESCALPKRNNVWSEVTSTESVEMLLNAVGQEEMLPGKSMIEESDPGDKLGSSIKQKESNLSQDDNIDIADCVNLTLKSDPSDKPGCSIKQMESNLSQDGNIDSDTVDFVNPSLESNLGEQPSSPMKQIESSLSQGDNIDAVDCINPSLGSDPGNRSPIRKIESKHDDKFNDVDCDFPSLRPVEPKGKYSRLNPSEGVEGVCTGYIVQTQEGIFGSHEVCVADKESSVSLDIDRTSTSGNRGETFELISDSLSDKLQQNIDVHDMDIRTKESFSQKITASVGDSGDQDKVSDISLVSSCCISKGITEGVMEQNVINTNDESLAGNTAETISSEMLCALEIASDVNDSKEEHAVHLPNIGEIVSMPEMVESVSTVERSSDAAFVVGPSDDNEHGTMALSSGTRINQLSEEIFDKSYRTSEEEGYIKGAVNSTSFDNAELNKVPATQPLDQLKSVGDENVFLGSKSSLEASSATFKFPIFATLSSPYERDFDSNANHADGPGNSIGSSFAGEYCEEESVIEDTRDVYSATLIQNEHGSPQTCGEDVPPRETYHQCSLDVFDCAKEDNTLPLGSKNMVSGNMKIPVEGAKNAERATGSLSSTPRDSKVFNIEVEDTTLAASETKVAKVPNISTPKKSFEVAAEVAPAIFKATQLDNAATEKAKMSDLSVSLAETFNSTMPIEATKDSYDIIKDSASDLISFEVAFEVAPAIYNTTQFDNAATEETKMGDLSVSLSETFNGTMPTEATKDSNDKIRDSASDLISFEVAADVSPAIYKATQLDYTAIEETKTADLSVTLAETFNGSMPIEATKDSNDKIKDSASDLILQNDDSEAAPTEKSMEAVIENCSQTNSSLVSVSSCPVQIDESDKLYAPVIECTELPQNQSNNNNVDNVGEFLSTSMNLEVNAISKAEGTFTFDVKPLGGQSVLESCKGVQSFPGIQACKHSLIREGSLSAPSNNQKDLMIVKEISDANSLLSSDGVRSSGDVKVKKRRGRGKHGSESAKKENLLKETTPLRQKESGDKSSLSPLGTGELLKVDHAAKPKGAISILTSSLPDLNTYSPSSALFQQPFKDLQQVQLRAQIFVYGSLIQGAAPDEAFMVSAFDGGRSIWEPSWRALVERLHGQKKKGNNTETLTPLQSRSGAKASGQSTIKGSTQSEVLFSPASRAINKATSSPLSPIIPLSSPLWNIATPSCEGPPSSSMSRSAIFDYQAFSPIHPYQTTPVGNFVAHTTSKSSQARFPVPWISSSQSPPFDIGAKYSTSSNTEPVKLTPVKNSSLAISSLTKPGSLVPLFNYGATTMSTGTSSLVDLKNTPTDTKSRKRKKSSGVGKIPIDASTASARTGTNCSPKNISALKDLSRISVNAQNQDSVSTPVPSCHYSTSIAATTPCLVPKETDQFGSVASPSISSDHLKRDDVIKDKMTLHLETFSKVEEAKLHAEEAASLAATTVSHCQAMWSQLNQQKNSGLTSDVEARLASAAVAIAAAAAVAKVAAAAAKIASSAAVQAKQMADEAVTVLGSEHNTTLVSNLAKNTAGASPVSIMQDGNLGLSSAKETARKRIKAASAATKQAENLDAILKAAELAAEAVSHTGIIVGMEDPFSLTQLVEAGPDGYWKSSHSSKTNDMNRSKFTCGIVGELPTVCPSLHECPDTDVCDAVPTVPPTQSEAPKNILGEHVAGEGSLITPKKQGEKNLELWKDKSASDSAKYVDIVSEPDIGSVSTFTFANSNGNSSINEGSAVEVLKDGLHSKKGWFSANILSLKDGKALVCYRELQSNEGSEQLKEWITLEPQGGEAPIIRVPHPMNAVQFDGTKKRRRAASNDYTWSVGDKVDAWVQDSWREGIVAEKNKKDATSLTVHFPAQGETVTLKVWHLRPTVIWVDGQWIEWCRPGHDATSQGDTPMEKRQKLQSVSMETKGKGKIAENINLVEERGAKEPILPLSAKEKEFSIGSMRDAKLPNMPRTMRSGLQKEGSRVVFGVPKPGKKRKFMDVSKHYVSDGSTKTSTEPNDSVKLSKYSAAQGSLSRGLKSNLKVDLKEKQAAESKPKALRSCKPPIPTRKLPRKEDSTTSSQSGEQNLAEFGSSSNVEATSKGTTVFSSRAFPPESRKASTKNNTKPDRLNKDKLVLGSWKSVKSESNQTLIPEVTEPRRSVRRIQPTSRLLEGLQSSLMVVQKTPSSNDKNHKSFLMKGSSRGNNSHG